jgi:hypothetical protein
MYQVAQFKLKSDIVHTREHATDLKSMTSELKHHRLKLFYVWGKNIIQRVQQEFPELSFNVEMEPIYDVVVLGFVIKRDTLREEDQDRLRSFLKQFKFYQGEDLDFVNTRNGKCDPDFPHVCSVGIVFKS